MASTRWCFGYLSGYCEGTGAVLVLNPAAGKALPECALYDLARACWYNCFPADRMQCSIALQPTFMPSFLVMVCRRLMADRHLCGSGGENNAARTEGRMFRSIRHAGTKQVTHLLADVLYVGLDLYKKTVFLLST